ncbi:MAG: helicase SNF2, partial [Oscillospiraceae bacterium]
GWGGHGCAFELGGDYNTMCSPSKGMDIQYSDYEHYIKFNLSFKQMEATISEQIALGIYPTPSDTSFERYKARYEAEITSNKITDKLEEGSKQLSFFGTNSIEVAKQETTNKTIENNITPAQDNVSPQQQIIGNIKLSEVGDFFEAYGEDAKVLSEQIGYTLTSKKIGDKSEAMVGFPKKLFDDVNKKLKEKSYALKTNADIKTPKIDFTVSELSYPKGKKAKYKANIEAINLLKQIEGENRFATTEEQVILSKYTGWGGLAEAFDNTKWAEEYTELKNSLNETEYKNALSSVNNAHYTPDIVIKSIYNAVGNMGFNGGNILEPACGTGNFFSLQNKDLKENSKLFGVELDSISGRISKHLHQNAEIHIKGFEQTQFGNNLFDLSVGNIPFGDYKVFDKAYKQQNFLVHDYFIAKMIDSTRPKGLVAVITSKGTMDKDNNKVRKYIAQRAELVGAIRLPNNTFQGTANSTEVTTDILFFQKREQLCDTVPDWVNIGEHSNGYKINQYFISNPSMMLGNWTEVSGQFGKKAELLSNGIPLEEQLNTAISYLPKGIYTENVNDENNKEEQASIPADYNVKDFTFAVIDDDIYYRENSKMYLKKFGETQSNRIKGLCIIRDNVKNIINMQIDGCTDEELEKAQLQLNNVYNNFVNQYGYIDTKGNRNVFKEDVDYPLLLSLENLDEEKNVVKSAIFTERTVATKNVITEVSSAIDGLAASLCDKGCVDIKHIEKISGLSFDKIINELKTSIFKNPLSNLEDKYDGWETADEYLSGNVVEKLSVAASISQIHTEFEINVEALKRVQPKPLSAGEISVQLGSPWVDKKYYEQFVFELLQTPRYNQDSMPLDYNVYNNTYTIRNKYKDRDNVLSYQTFGTGRISAYQIIEDCLNQKMSQVRDAILDDDKTKYVVNQQETYKARSKQDIIKDKFSKWIFDNKERRDFLVDKYNRYFNCIVPREYNGDIFSFDGMNPKIKLRQHQKNAVARMVLTGKALLAHEVGAGKTFTYIAGIMEMKRIGLCNKSIITVPNHLTEQQGHDILQLYPSANILVATSDDFSKGKRQRLISQIATGNFDIVVIGHSQFEKLTMPPEVIERNINEELETLEIALNEAENNDTPRYTIKQMETTKKRLEEKLQSLLDDSGKDNV